MIVVFLGAGFSSLAGVPLASELFDERPEVDRITRRKLVDRVLGRWGTWQDEMHGAPEEYLGHLQGQAGPEWREAVWYVSLVIALKMGRVESVGGKPTITRHNLNRTSRVPAHEALWSCIFRQTEEVAVLTTNYDILAERGLRNAPRPRVPRPGFHYGEGKEHLRGGGYPSYTHIQAIDVDGHVPLLKLHGSVSWSVRNGVLEKFHDCRPAIRGDAAIVAPVVNKNVLGYLQPIWAQAERVLSTACSWVFIGYSLPEYDQQVSQLLKDGSCHSPQVHVFDPNPAVAQRFRTLLETEVVAHGRIPDALEDLEKVVAAEAA